MTKPKLTTSQLRRAWAPPCTGPWARVTLFGGAVVSVRPAMVEAVLALDACFRAFNYPNRPADTGAFNCRTITGSSSHVCDPEHPEACSLHAFGIAIDSNWATNPYGHTLVTDRPSAMNDAIKAIRTNSGAQVWGWGGDYGGNKDAMHDEAVCSPADLATGIDPATVPGGHVVTTIPTFPKFPGQMGPKQGNAASIKVAQTEAKKLGFYHGPIDGKFSPAFGAAVELSKQAHDVLIFLGGDSDLSHYWGEYKDGKGTWDPIIGGKTWRFWQFLAAANARR